MATPYVTLMGNITAEPELRFVPSGKAVANFTVATSDRKKDDSTDTWSDGDKMFTRAAIWEQVAEQVAESGLPIGTEVIVNGQLYVREYEKDGVKRSSVELKNVRIAVEITKGQTVTVHRTARTPARAGAAPANRDPWTTGGGSVSPFDEPPF